MSGWALAATTLAVLLSVAAAAGLWRRVRRARWVASVPAAEVRRRSARIPVALHAVPGSLPNVFGGRVNRDVADLLLTDDRLVLVANRGVLLDLRRGEEGARRLTGIRCPAPHQLVLLGERRRASSEPAEFRIELALTDAADWAEALQGFAPASPYGIRPDFS